MGVPPGDQSTSSPEQYTSRSTSQFDHIVRQTILLYLPTQIRFPIGGERITCHGSKLTNSLGRTKLTYSLGKQQLELSIRTWSGRAPWNRGKCVELFTICSIIELGGITNHLMTDPSGNSSFFSRESQCWDSREKKLTVSFGNSH